VVPWPSLDQLEAVACRVAEPELEAVAASTPTTTPCHRGGRAGRSRDVG